MEATSNNQKPARIKVKYFQRKARPTGNFSLEFIFDDVRKRLAERIDSTVRIAPYLSNGLFRRVAICFDAWRHQAGVNHVTGDTTFSAIGLRSGRTALTILDCGVLSRHTGLKRWLIKQLWFDWPVRRASVVTTISSSVQSEIINLTGCDPDKVRVVPVAVSNLFSKIEKPFSIHCPRILHLGTAPNKNLPRLIQALEGIDCTLVVIGKLDLRTAELIQRCGIQVENHFNLTMEEVVQQYVSSDMICFVSTYEGFGMPIVEANVVGRAVVTSNTSSMPEVAGEAACLVDPYDVNSIRTGIERVINDKDYRESLITKGLENAKRFDGDRIAEMYHEVYGEIANGT